MQGEGAKVLRHYVHGKIRGLSSGSPRCRAALARLRRAVGKAPGVDPDIWSETLDGLPEGMAGHGKDPSRGEWSVHTALTLYAIHVQSSDSPAHVPDVGFGQAVGQLAAKYDGSGNNPHQKRMAEVSRSDDIGILSWRMRGLIRLLGQAGIGFDYGRLAEDLYWFQNDDTRRSVILSWGRGYSGAIAAARRTDGAANGDGSGS